MYILRIPILVVVSHIVREVRTVNVGVGFLAFLIKVRFVSDILVDSDLYW